MLTAFSQRDLIERARDAGAMAYLVKPFQKRDLLPAIEMGDQSRFAEIRALESEVTGLAENSPFEAAHFVANLPPGDAQDTATGVVVEKWTQRDPAAAANWVASFGAGDVRDTAIGRVVGPWAEASPEAARAWVETLPPDHGREIAMHAYIEKAAATSPASVAGWALAITDPELRHSAITTLAQQWVTLDAAAASTWLATTGLNDEERRTLLGEKLPP